MAEIRVNTTGTLKLFDADDSHSAGIAAGTITADATLMTLNTADIDISVPIDVTGASTITTADNTDTLTLISTDADDNSGPNLRMYRNSGSPADSDVIGQIQFEGKNDAAEDVVYNDISMKIADASDGTEDGIIRLRNMQAGTLRQYISTSGTEVVINEDSVDIDFRVEGNGDANAFFVEGSTDHIGMGTNDPDSPLHVHVGSAGSVTAFDTTGVTIEDSDNATLNFLSPDASQSRILFGSPSDNVGASIKWSHDTNAFEIKGGTGSSQLQLGGAQSTQMLINNGGNVGIGTTSPGNRLHVLKSANTYVMAVENTNSTPYGLRVQYTDGPDNSDNQFFEANDENATRFRVLADGDVKNHDNSYGSLSDERIKQDIRDSNSQWDDIKAVKVRNFKKKDDVRQYGDKAWEQIGVIAQELETVSPKLIRKHNPNSCDIISSSEFGTLYTSDDAETQDAVLYAADDQEVIDGDKNVGDIKTPSTKKIGDVKEIKEQVKSVNYSILYMKAIKALQEAMAKIETLETKVKALEDA